MPIEYVAPIVLFGGIILALLLLLKLIQRGKSRYYRKMFRGHLREDYIKNNPDLVRNGNAICACGGEKVVLRNLGPVLLGHEDVVREHVCHSCGNRLFYSASGTYFESIVRELRAEAGYVKSAKAPVRA
jgi:hypothetical protein